MDDVWIMILTIFSNISHAEFLSQQHIDLDGDQGVFLTEYILDLDIQFWSVESSFVNTNFVVQTQMIQNLLHCILCFFPLLCSTFVFIGSVWIPLAEAVAYILSKTNCFQTVFCKFQTTAEFVFQLVWAENQVTFRMVN